MGSRTGHENSLTTVGWGGRRELRGEAARSCHHRMPRGLSGRCPETTKCDRSPAVPGLDPAALSPGTLTCAEGC
ncbi:hypothetical protein FM103_00800 [Corynebacterium xerosis]|nr:hypothetical protein FM103_00800 [Corynebacterium xerosis]